MSRMQVEELCMKCDVKKNAYRPVLLPAASDRTVYCLFHFDVQQEGQGKEPTT